jgi:molecular chaperone GrpE
MGEESIKVEKESEKMPDFSDTISLSTDAVTSSIQEDSSAVATAEENELTDQSVQPEVAQPPLPKESSPASGAEDEAAAPVPFEKFQEVLQAKDQLYDRFLRKQAEFENFRKRMERDKQEFYDFALSNFIKDVLPIIDGLERGLYVSESDNVESYKKGIELILKQFRDVLATVGLQPIRAIGTIFDPNYHQAVIREENNMLAENEIIEELQRGYTYKDRLLRPSMVKVAVPSVSTAPVENAEKEP